MAIASGLPQSLVKKAKRPGQLRNRSPKDRTKHRGPASILDSLTETLDRHESLIAETLANLDLLNSTVTSAMGLRSQFFENSLRAFGGRLTKKDRHFEEGNKAEQFGDVAADRGLIESGMGQYRSEFKRLYGFSAEEAARLESPTIIRTVNKRATLAANQWSQQLENYFNIVIKFHDTCTDDQWNRFVRSKSSSEAVAWLSIENVEVYRGPGVGGLRV